MRENPALADKFPDEKVWDDKGDLFCGGYRNRGQELNIMSEVWYTCFIYDYWIVKGLPFDQKEDACYPGGDTILHNIMSETICAGASEKKWCGGGSEAYCGQGGLMQLNQSRYKIP